MMRKAYKLFGNLSEKISSTFVSKVHEQQLQRFNTLYIKAKASVCIVQKPSLL